MPRRNQHRNARAGRPQVTERATLGDAFARREAGPRGGEMFSVRNIPASRALKTYRCPGCDHEIGPGTAHVVAWPDRDAGGPDERRHWHTGCWSGRASRSITRRWS
ncbi:ATP/GTP-binding protein [Rhodococcus sp. D2-41]|uniref:ATP/GTP-binding protein n=1 Tax=Speluncibacter jeojiensis TaxID=2710754 RepID=A0A9X4M5B3_9ACTN|nr:ATP/GTP-binding protein [Rhodococcus sp. D2-41]MDG3012811.1 ATP/GTP-binding protein [Rhodococcus sp. D2-41]MDG3017129.1 ATP/GTP-binding protein [Corynebacteriales bacterium D3-21]